MGITCKHGLPDLPGWGIGQWGLMPWDSEQLPGNIDTNLIAYNLKIANLGAYPGSGWTAEIQTRDLKDRVHHTFQRYATCDQILADGNMAMFAGIFIRNDEVYVSTVPGYLSNSSRQSCTSVSLYKLVSVGTDKVGVFELVGQQSIGTSAPAYQYESCSYEPGCRTDMPASLMNYSLGNMGGAYVDRRSTFSDYYGSHDVSAGQDIIANVLLAPFNQDLAPLLVTVSEHSENRVVAISTYLNDPRLSENRQAWLNVRSRGLHSLTFHGVSGLGTSASEVAGADWNTTINSPVVLAQNGRTIAFCHWSGSDFIFEPKIAHPMAFNRDCNWAIAWGTAYTMASWTGSAGSKTESPYRIDYATKTVVERVGAEPIFYVTELCGIWGDSEAYVYHTDLSSLVSWDKFFVIKASDTTAAHKYSTFSTLDEDGEILHVEGLEDVTPALWIGNTRVLDLN